MAERPRDLWAQLNMAVTHIGLSAPGAVSARAQGRTTVITGNQVRTVTLVLSGHTSATTTAVQDHFGWPVWDAPAVLAQDHGWKAVFNSANRTFEGFYDESKHSTDPEIVRIAVPVRLTDDMWHMLEKTGAVVMCIGLTGDPTTQAIATGVRQRRFRAALVEALFH
ncbi:MULTISPECIES: hypothetical protein [unclassified Streptomyces]|uniref:hypothetical protein n=1 Tax=unclassified Streptomyces TaxID=2593676 RepID=UPI002E2DA405|nr:hypothetical protein [Streptomyces sp. NBC_00223]